MAQDLGEPASSLPAPLPVRALVDHPDIHMDNGELTPIAAAILQLLRSVSADGLELTAARCSVPPAAPLWRMIQIRSTPLCCNASRSGSVSARKPSPRVPSGLVPDKFSPQPSFSPPRSPRQRSFMLSNCSQKAIRAARACLRRSEAMFAEDFGGRICGFDSDAARVFSRIAAHRRARGRPISHADAQIAAIAQARGAKLATHNVADFEDCNVDVVDPWSGS